MLDAHASLEYVILIVFFLIILLVTLIFLLLTRERADAPASEEAYGRAVTSLITAAEANPDIEYVRETSADFDAYVPKYDNSRTLSCQLNTGDTVTVGRADNPSSDLLYICPKVAPAPKNAGHIYAVYVWCDSNGIRYPEELAANSLIRGETYILLGRTYEHLGTPDKLAWAHGNVTDGSEFSNICVEFRVVDLTDSLIAGVCSCDIVWDGEYFSLAGLRSNEIRDIGECPDALREELIRIAHDFMTVSGSGVLGNILVDLSTEIIKSKAVVQHAAAPYFDIILDKDGRYIRSESIPFIHPYAVSFSSPVGPVTVYIADSEEYSGSEANRLNAGNSERKPESRYYAFAYDILCPLSDDYLILPPTLQPVSDKLQLRDMYA